MQIKEIEVKSVMTKSNLPVSDYSVNPYVGCTHGCKYCYASFMKRFTNHPEPWGDFIDVKYWPEIKKPEKYAGKEAFFGSVTDCYQPCEAKYKRTRALLEELREYAAAEGFTYVRDDDSRRADFGELPIIANYFYHEEVKKSAKKDKEQK